MLNPDSADKLRNLGFRSFLYRTSDVPWESATIR